MEKKLIRKGKVKEVYDIGDRLEFLFTNNISVFDKIIPTKIESKGAVLCGISAFWFKKCEEMGIKTHFIEKKSSNEMIVKKFRIMDSVSKKTKNYLIPLEVIARYYVAGSFYERVKNKGIKYGEKLEEPIIEFTTKFESYDRLLDEKEAMKIGGLDYDDINEIKEVVLKIDEHMQHEVKKRGLIHVDGKKEFAFDEERRLVVVDTFGTPDEDRFWDMESYEKGKFVELSKEFVRNYYKKIGYYSMLKEAREKNLPEPEIPPLPNDVAREVSLLYISLYEKITGERFK
ncbi:phosphoribosylaminoimidazolesuccinocarboxamide synthase [Thermoplasmatales archaeon ex4484_30]|nr:MAG: phosphoribosylaminoimidazolesuccinocarboxamide synthase [Thermoplasmatales archaeon ex4484_30]